MNIRRATIDDFVVLYDLASKTPEFRASATEPFMSLDELRYCIGNPASVFLLAETEKSVVGFIYANTQDVERPERYACLVYLAVHPEHRRQGIAKRLYQQCEEELKQRGISYIYGWAKSGGKIIDFMKQEGFTEGHQYVWMDKKLEK